MRSTPKAAPTKMCFRSRCCSRIRRNRRPHGAFRPIDGKLRLNAFVSVWPAARVRIKPLKPLWTNVSWVRSGAGGVAILKRALAVALALGSPLAPVAFTAVLAVQSAPVEARDNSCGADSYINSRGHCVPRPRRSPSQPSGATAQCRDGTYSFSESRRGTCSHHGGVARWL
jgi:hypothetical protein